MHHAAKATNAVAPEVVAISHGRSDVVRSSTALMCCKVAMVTIFRAVALKSGNNVLRPWLVIYRSSYVLELAMASIENS